MALPSNPFDDSRKYLTPKVKAIFQKRQEVKTIIEQFNDLPDLEPGMVRCTLDQLIQWHDVAAEAKATIDAHIEQFRMESAQNRRDALNVSRENAEIQEAIRENPPSIRPARQSDILAEKILTKMVKEWGKPRMLEFLDDGEQPKDAVSVEILTALSLLPSYKNDNPTDLKSIIKAIQNSVAAEKSATKNLSQAWEELMELKSKNMQLENARNHEEDIKELSSQGSVGSGGSQNSPVIVRVSRSQLRRSVSAQPPSEDNDSTIEDEEPIVDPLADSVEESDSETEAEDVDVEVDNAEVDRLNAIILAKDRIIRDGKATSEQQLAENLALKKCLLQMHHFSPALSGGQRDAYMQDIMSTLDLNPPTRSTQIKSGQAMTFSDSFDLTYKPCNPYTPDYLLAIVVDVLDDKNPQQKTMMHLPWLAVRLTDIFLDASPNELQLLHAFLARAIDVVPQDISRSILFIIIANINQRRCGLELWQTLVHTITKTSKFGRPYKDWDALDRISLAWLIANGPYHPNLDPVYPAAEKEAISKLSRSMEGLQPLDILSLLSGAAVKEFLDNEPVKEKSTVFKLSSSTAPEKTQMIVLRTGDQNDRNERVSLNKEFIWLRNKKKVTFHQGGLDVQVRDLVVFVRPISASKDLPFFQVPTEHEGYMETYYDDQVRSSFLQPKKFNDLSSDSKEESDSGR